MIFLMLTVLITDISGQGYTDLLMRTFNKDKAQTVANDFEHCEVFTDVDTKEYSVICKEKTYITGLGKTKSEVK